MPSRGVTATARPVSTSGAASCRSARTTSFGVPVEPDDEEEEADAAGELPGLADAEDELRLLAGAEDELPGLAGAEDELRFLDAAEDELRGALDGAEDELRLLAGA